MHCDNFGVDATADKVDQDLAKVVSLKGRCGWCKSSSFATTLHSLILFKALLLSAGLDFPSCPLKSWFGRLSSGFAILLAGAPLSFSGAHQGTTLGVLVGAVVSVPGKLIPES